VFLFPLPFESKMKKSAPITYFLLSIKKKKKKEKGYYVDEACGGERYVGCV
jgi:hypothetical protein